MTKCLGKKKKPGLYPACLIHGFGRCAGSRAAEPLQKWDSSSSCTLFMNMAPAPELMVFMSVAPAPEFFLAPASVHFHKLISLIVLVYLKLH